MVADAEPSTLRLAAAYADLLRAQGAEELADQWAEAVSAADPENLLGVVEVPEIAFSEEDGPTEEDGPAEDPAPAEAAPAEVHGGANFQAEVEAEVAELLGETDAPDSPVDDAEH
jgi:hypothetical protein